ncbi:hypothetical protein EDD90_3573 [Streptomyces sp. Ag109_O5-1]|uniref:VCBS repeat-containing protein n=1 Tax=Streptomyces sp. Ag109_O5-1 TaxID=1938851 RepID=UPI000F5159FC|nr:VCBS repeat-containing protein [Streptomyces sp. Ag109_O5-1]RPE40520.1 hypothetical protein EDD90_3573 [Streptomyces sp. Ag109_O5-1]
MTARAWRWTDADRELARTMADPTDLLVSSLRGNSVTPYEGATGGTLTQLTDVPATGAYDATAADLDGDGVRDLVVADSTGGQVGVFRGTCR